MIETGNRKEQRSTRNIIQIVSRYKSLSAQEISTQFKDGGIYADKAAWAKFIDILLLSLGVAFTIAGTIFFFAYNWDELHKFVKLGVVQFLILAGVTAVFLFKSNQLIKNVLLTATSMLVGLLFSVFGQIYQTGADAYDFFLGWTVFVLLWALVSAFPPLWLLLLTLINITFSLYVSQTGPDWTAVTTYLILAIVNLAAIILVKFLALKNFIVTVPAWFEKIVVIMAVSCLTISLVGGIYSKYQAEWFLALAAGVVFYTGGIGYALKHKLLYLLCIIPLSVILVFASFILEVFETGAFLPVSFVIVASVTYLVNELVKLNKKWNGED